MVFGWRSGTDALQCSPGQSPGVSPKQSRHSEVRGREAIQVGLDSPGGGGGLPSTDSFAPVL